MDTLLSISLLAMILYHFNYRIKDQQRRERAARLSVKDPVNQLRYVTSAEFYPKRVMNREEYAVFQVVERLVQSLNNGHRVFAQTSLGEVIGTGDDNAFASINSKRVDIVVIDPFGHPAAAIEYQGSGHYQGNAATADAVKEAALRQAGIAYLEIFEGDPSDEIRAKVLRALTPKSPTVAMPNG